MRHPRWLCPKCRKLTLVRHERAPTGNADKEWYVRCSECWGPVYMRKIQDAVEKTGTVKSKGVT